MKLKATDVPDRFTITRTREARNAMGGTAPMFSFISGSDLVIIDGTDISVLNGRLRNWVAAHLDDSSIDEAKALQTGETIAIETSSGLAFNIPGEPIPQAEPFLAPIAPDAPVAIPTPDLPPVPGSTEEWAARIDGAMLRQVPALPPVEENEEVDAYAERALIPLSLTVAEAAKEKAALQAALEPLYTASKRIADSWVPLIDAAQMTFTHAAPATDAGVKVGDIAVLAEGGESPEAAALRVAEAHSEEARPEAKP